MISETGCEQKILIHLMHDMKGDNFCQQRRIKRSPMQRIVSEYGQQCGLEYIVIQRTEELRPEERPEAPLA